MNFLPSLKRWQIVALVVLLLVVAGAAYSVYGRVTGPDTIELASDQQVVPVRLGDLVNRIAISGSVSFPERESMTFGSDGVVDEVLVKEGQRVSKGDPIAKLDAEAVARLEREVTEASVGVRDALDALDNLVEPKELAVAEARQRVTAAQDTLDDATDALVDIVTPSALAVSEMDARVAAAAQSLRDAEDALEAGVKPVSDLALAQAEKQVSDAEVALADTEEALDDFQKSPTKLQIAQATAKVANAEVALNAAIESLDDYRAGPPEYEPLEARQAVGTAQEKLDNAAADQRVSRRDWEIRLDEAQKELDETGRAYADTFAKWLGITQEPASLDPDYETALSEFGVDLDALFSGTERFEALGYGGGEIPADDVSTAWNEPQVFIWLNFARSDLMPTCEPGDSPTFGVCIEDEFRTSADAYQQSIDKKAEAVANDATALTASESAIDAAKAELNRAIDRLEEFNDPLDQVKITAMTTDIEVAEQLLSEADRELDELRDPHDQLAITSRLQQIELAQATLADAREKLEELADPVEAATIEHLSAQVELAQATLADERERRAELLSGEEHPGYAAALEAVSVVRLTLDERLEDLDKLVAPDPIDRALLVSRVDAAHTLLSESEKRLADANLMAPREGFVSRVDVDAGQDVKATDVVVVLVDTGVVEVDGSVDEIDVLSIEIGVGADVAMDALPDQKIPGSVSFIGAEANSEQGVVTYPVKVRMTVPSGVALPAGLSAVASITISEEMDVLLAPVNALRGSFDAPTLNVMRDGQVVETRVTLGISDDFWTIITDGVEEGDMVVMPAPDSSDVQFDLEGGGDEGPPEGRRRGR